MTTFRNLVLAMAIAAGPGLLSPLEANALYSVKPSCGPKPSAAMCMFAGVTFEFSDTYAALGK